MLTSDTLNLAADLIEQRGWTNVVEAPESAWGGGATGSAPVCLEGGILAALGVGVATDGLTDAQADQLVECPAYRAVAAHLDLGISGRLYNYNDAEGRTAEEVIEVLRATAVIEAARESSAARECNLSAEVRADLINASRVA